MVTNTDSETHCHIQPLLGTHVHTETLTDRNLCTHPQGHRLTRLNTLNQYTASCKTGKSRWKRGLAVNLVVGENVLKLHFFTISFADVSYSQKGSYFWKTLQLSAQESHRSGHQAGLAVQAGKKTSPQISHQTFRNQSCVNVYVHG